MSKIDNHIRKELELESFLQKLDTEKNRETDSDRLRLYVRRELLSKSPREIRDIFPDLWEEYKSHSRKIEATRKQVLEVITRNDFDIEALERTIANRIIVNEGKDFAFRIHQADGLVRIGEFFREKGRRSGYIKLPTGMGKTILFSALIRVFCENNPNTRVLILSPRNIVNEQNIKAINRLQDPETIVGITRSSKKIVDARGKIITEETNALVSTYQLLTNTTVNEQKFGKRDVIILDELHKSFGFRTVESIKSSYPNAIFLGLSATPYLGDPTGKNPKRAEDYIGECIMSISLPDAIESGALVPVRGFLVHTKGEEIDKLIQSGEDLSDIEYEEKIDGKQRSEIALKILGDYMENGTKKLTRRAIIYCVGIEHTEETSKFLQDAGINVAFVHSKMPNDEIKKMITDYKNGKYDVICNSDMLIEGFDDEKISLLINLRPTRSLTVFEQMIGRALRLDENNPGKVAHVYNVTGIFSEEYTIYGLAKHYKKLEKTTKNGSLVFPSKLSDIERKIQKYESSEVIPNWIDEEKTLMKQYLPEWYEHFFEKIDSTDKGSRPRDNRASRLDFPDIIETEKIERFIFPMDLEYFQSFEYLMADYDAFEGNNKDEIITCANGNKINLRNYLTAIKKNVPLMQDTTPEERLAWWRRQVETSNPKFDIEFFQNIENLKKDYINFDIGCQGKLRIEKGMRFKCINQRSITIDSYLNYIERVTPEMRGKTKHDCLNWWRGQIGEIKFDTAYFRNVENLRNDYKEAKIAYDGNLQKGLNHTGFLSINREYVEMGYYLDSIRNVIPEMRGKTKHDCLNWWRGQIGVIKFDTAYFRNVENLRNDYKESGIKINGKSEKGFKSFLCSNKEYIELYDYYLCIQSNISEMKGASETICLYWWIGQIGEIKFHTAYFQNVENLRIDYGNYKAAAGESEKYTVKFLCANGEKVDLYTYFNYMRAFVHEIRNRNWPYGYFDWWRDKVGIIDGPVVETKFTLDGGIYKINWSAWYFEDTLNLKVDYRALKKASNSSQPSIENMSVTFSCMSGDDVSLGEYLNAIRTHVPTMQNKNNNECLEWWKNK